MKLTKKGNDAQINYPWSSSSRKSQKATNQVIEKLRTRNTKMKKRSRFGVDCGERRLEIMVAGDWVVVLVPLSSLSDTMVPS